MPRPCPACLNPPSECICIDDEETGRDEWPGSGFLGGLSAQRKTAPAMAKAAEKMSATLAEDLARNSIAALKPGDVLAVRVPLRTSLRDLGALRAHAETLEAETGVKVMYVPGEEFQASTVNVTMHFSGNPGDPQALAREIREQVRRQVPGRLSPGQPPVIRGNELVP